MEAAYPIHPGLFERRYNDGGAWINSSAPEAAAPLALDLRLKLELDKHLPPYTWPSG